MVQKPINIIGIVFNVVAFGNFFSGFNGTAPNMQKAVKSKWKNVPENRWIKREVSPNINLVRFGKCVLCVSQMFTAFVNRQRGGETESIVYVSIYSFK